MKKYEQEYEFENELKQLTYPDDLVEEISEGYPVLDDAAKERIFKLCEKKMGENMKKDNNIEMNNNENMETISGVDHYEKPKWYSHVLTIAASLLLVAGVGIGVVMINNGDSVEPATQLEASDAESGEYSFEAVVIEEESVGQYIVTPLVDEEERKTSDRFSIKAEPGIHKGEVVRIHYDGYIQTIYPSTVNETKVERVMVESPNEAVCNYICVLHPGSDISNGEVSVGQYDRVGFMYTYSPLAEQFGITEETSVHAPIAHYTADGTEYSEMMIVMSGDYGFYVIDHFGYDPQEMTATVTEVLETGYDGSVQYYMVLPENSSTEMKVYSVAQLGNYDTGDATNTFSVGEKVVITYNAIDTYGTALRYAENSETMVFSMVSLDEAEAAAQQLLEEEQQALEEQLRQAEESEEEEEVRKQMEQELRELENQQERLRLKEVEAEAEAAGLTLQELSTLYSQNTNCMLYYVNSCHTIQTEGGAVDGKNLYQVAPSQFGSYADFEEYVRSIYCKEAADSYLSSCKDIAGFNSQDKPLFVEYDGMLCIDKSVELPETEYEVNNFAIQIVSFENNVCEFAVVTTDTFYNVTKTYVTYEAVLEDDGWRLKEMC